VKTVVWTDGSCNANGMRGRGGWAALIEQAGTVREISGSADGTTQHRMELTAVCEALEALTGAIEVRTDSPYVEKCFNQNWHERWLRDGLWKGSKGAVKNRDLWERLFGLVWDDGRRDVTFTRIRGHAGDPNNHRVDWLARAAAVSDALPHSFAVVEVVETPARARRRKTRRAPWRELLAAEMAAHLLETPTINDRAWTHEPRLPRETRAAFIRRVLLRETEPVEAPE
jgi:ribonuclease HI